ncbi:MAG: DUF1566 domain-containing protein [Cocleimonas sp.]|nr:DUF1566 domain-containing protein [Cocleimonas sp.]MCK5895430.1 DUF1566 domain-containing protein [Cocleimonas sp.]
MNDIFISHSSNDRPWVSLLATALQAEGYRVNWEKNHLTNENFAAIIQDTFEQCQCVITVWSQQAITSFSVKAETLIAMEQNLLIPIFCEHVIPPMPYASLSTEALQSWKGDRNDLRYQHLLQTIRKFTQPEPILQAGKYIDNNDDTITDCKTNLMWKKYSEGQRDITCGKGMVRQYTWETAVNRFKQSSFAGYNDWRLPTVKELRSLVSCQQTVASPLTEERHATSLMNEKCTQPTINKNVFPNTSPTRYWTSSTFFNKEDYAWALHFDSGNDEESLKHYNASVRLVRTSQMTDQGYIKLFNRSTG